MALKIGSPSVTYTISNHRGCVFSTPAHTMEPKPTQYLFTITTQLSRGQKMSNNRDIEDISRRSYLKTAGIIAGSVLGTAGAVQAKNNTGNEPRDPRDKHAGENLYTPSENSPVPGAMYPRVTRLEHAGPGNSNEQRQLDDKEWPDNPGQRRGPLLATFEYYPSTTNGSEPYFPLYRSTNGGRSWALYSEIHDTQNGWGLRYQPTLFELPTEVGPWPAGTVLAAGNSIPSDLSETHIELYASTDQGKTWSYVSTVVTGGAAIPYAEGDPTPVWEPELALDAESNLVCYFADERHLDDGYDQLIGHKVSENGGQSWGNERYDVALEEGYTRPGMPTVVKFPNGNYMMSYEIVGSYGGTVHVKTSPDGVNWNPHEPGVEVATDDDRRLVNGPYITWTPQGGDDGTVLVSGKTLRETSSREQAPGSGKVILANTNLDGTGNWTPVSAPLWFRTSEDTGNTSVGWTTPLLPSPNGKQLLEMTSTYLGPERTEIRYAKRPLKLNKL